VQWKDFLSQGKVDKEEEKGRATECVAMVDAGNSGCRVTEGLRSL